MGLTPVPDDHVATVVTALEMRTKPLNRPLPQSRLRLAHWRAPSPAAYRALFARVGAPWLWFSRLALSDAQLSTIIARTDASIHAVVDPAGIEVGMLELERAAPDTCRIAYFGLIPDLAGQGHGRWLMAHALALGWGRGVTRMVVNTCTLDHPRALGFYRAQGFVAVARTLETFLDPRITGLLPADAAPQVPLLGAASRL